MTPMKRDSMVFYDSFYLAIKDLPPEQFKECACALLDYGLLGIEKSNEGISQTVLIMAKPNIDKNNQRWLNAQKSKRYDLYECGESEEETQLKPELKKSKPKSKKASHKSDTKDKKAYTEAIEEALKEEITPMLWKMTRYEGKILLKLIDRETHHTAFNIIKEFRSGVTATFYQLLAQMFGNNLKLHYDPDGEDEMLEYIVKQYRAGTL